MLTRRGVLLASVAAGIAMNTKAALAKAAQPSTAVNFDVPPGACDCHTHIHADPRNSRSLPAGSTRPSWPRPKR